MTPWLLPAAAMIGLLCLPDAALATFPGRDGEIVYTRTDSFRNQTVWSVEPRTGQERQLTQVPEPCRRVRAGWLDDVPTYSASGRHIFYGHSGDCARGNNPYGLYRLPAQGGAARLVVRDRSLRATWWPVPLAGGKRLLFANDLSISRRRDWDGYSNTIFSASLGAGRGVFRRLSPRGATSDEFPAASASGRLAFARDHHRLVVGAARRPLRDGNLRLLAAYRGWSISTPDFSPDGRRILFARDRHRDGFDSAIFVIGVRGRGLHRLTRTGDPVSPVWSPSGRRIAFVRAPDDAKPYQGPLYVMDREGRRARKLLDGVDDTRLSWQPVR